MPAITSANVANAIVKLVAADALPALVGNLVMGNLVNRDYEPTLAQAGDTVNVPIPPTMVANNIARRRDGADAESEPGQRADRAEHARGSDVPDSGRDEGAGGAGPAEDLHAAGGGRDRGEDRERPAEPVLRSSRRTRRWARPGTPITEAVIDAAETALFQAKVPASEPKYLVVDAATYSQLRQIPRFSEYQTAGEAGLRALVDGTVGKIKDFFVFRSQFVPKTGSSPVTTHNLAFAKNAIGLVMRRLPQPLPGTGAIAEYAELGNFGMRVTMSYQPNTLAQQFTVDVLYGCGVLRNSLRRAGEHLNRTAVGGAWRPDDGGAGPLIH